MSYNKQFIGFTIITVWSASIEWKDLDFSQYLILNLTLDLLKNVTNYQDKTKNTSAIDIFFFTLLLKMNSSPVISKVTSLGIPTTVPRR